MILSQASRAPGPGRPLAEPPGAGSLDRDRHPAIAAREIERLARRHHEARMRLQGGAHPAIPTRKRR